MVKNALGNDRLSEVEVAALQQTLYGNSDSRAYGASTVQDLAEATGLSVGEVRAHLSRLRAESSFQPEVRERKPISLVGIAGGFALLAGGYVLWNRTAGQPSYKPEPPSFTSPGVTAPLVRRAVADKHLGQVVIQNGLGAPPPGIRVDVIGQATSYEGDGMTMDTKRMPYEMACQQISRSLAMLALYTALQDRRHVQPPDGPYRDSMGNSVMPRPGYAHYSVDGWAGEISGWIKLPDIDAKFIEFIKDNTFSPDADAAFLTPLVPAMLKDLEKVGPELYGKVYQDQADGLRSDGIDVNEGILEPPPGFSVKYMGRRTDSQQGAILAFAPVDEAAIAKRLELSIRNAMKRDSGPPVGAWTEADKISMKHPVPKLARVEVTSPDSEMTAFDLPTSGGAMRSTLADWCAKAAHRIQKQNSTALTTPTDKLKK